jgi:hypothetical protein
MVGRVINIEMTFLQQWRVGVRLSGEGGRRRWCGFNASISAREGRQWYEALLEDEVKVASLSWLHG